ncbi:MmcQ/YjbR family DNA-binding protein [Caulobacter sp. KR2-114]|uniref:MmcQ/YjbR family DNA-binding protein n=1 Tax=Caulobacter sp. KR2-114 TaxID=3400912 RepID=UPI003BFE1B66
MELDPRTTALKARLDAFAGAGATPVPVPANRPTPALMYKVMGRLFAILAVRGEPSVILKCDPHLVEILREQYAGVGHRSHLDRRFWICVTLGSDVPDAEVERLVAQSYDLVRAGLTRKQKAELEALS